MVVAARDCASSSGNSIERERREKSFADRVADAEFGLDAPKAAFWRIYAREGVAHAWLIDPSRQTLEVLAVEAGRLEPLEAHQGNASVRARPFELELRALWI